MSLYERLGRFMCRRSYATYRIWFYLVVVPRLLILLPGVVLDSVRTSLVDSWRSVVRMLPHTLGDWMDARGGDR